MNAAEEEMAAVIRGVGVDAAALVRLIRKAPPGKGGLVPAIEYAERLDADSARTSAVLLAMMVVALEREPGRHGQSTRGPS